MQIGEPKRILIVEPLTLPEPLRQPQQIPNEPVIQPKPVKDPETVPATPDKEGVPA